MSIYSYTAYSLGISSELLLPELETSAEVATDITIRLAEVSWSPRSNEDDFCFEVNPQDAYFFWSHLGKFHVQNGSEIVIDPIPGVEERLLRLPLLGTILAVVLHQRGYLVLHASSAAIDGATVIFLGNKGWGKSTMAATLYGRGHQLVSDDVVAIRFTESGNPVVIPGFPQFKLYPEAVVSSLGDDYEALPELAEGYEKRGRQVTERFAQQPLPLRSLYALGCGPTCTLKPLTSQAALLMLIANSYMARFGKQLLQGVEASTHLRQCSELIRQVSAHRLERPRSLSLLPMVAQLVEDHVRQLGAVSPDIHLLPKEERKVLVTCQ